MELKELKDVLDAIAPPSLAEEWDNVGLLCGDLEWDVSGVMLTIDYTKEVAEEAAEAKCDLVVAYHPPIFSPLKRITGESLVFDAIRRGVAIYSPHTALDVIEGGTNDVLADVIGLKDRRALRAAGQNATHFKLVVFVPNDALEKVRTALFAAGAGRIGKYTSCSFGTEGTGTFFGDEGTNPAVGKSGKLERAAEVRLETVVPIEKVDEVISALRKSHPYEEPAFDLNVLAPAGGQAAGKIGMGRVGTMESVSRKALLEQIKRSLGLSHVLVAGPEEGMMTRAAVCAGSCGDLLADAIAAGAQFYLTGEMRHHDAVKAAAAGVTAVCTLHSNSERGILKMLKGRLEKISGMPPVSISAADRDPFAIR